MYDKLVPLGLYGCFGETSELTGAEHLAAARAVSPEISRKFMTTWSAYQKDVIEAAQDIRSVRQSAHQSATLPAA